MPINGEAQTQFNHLIPNIIHHFILEARRRGSDWLIKSKTFFTSNLPSTIHHLQSTINSLSISFTIYPFITIFNTCPILQLIRFYQRSSIENLIVFSWYQSRSSFRENLINSTVASTVVRLVVYTAYNGGGSLWCVRSSSRGDSRCAQSQHYRRSCRSTCKAT